MKSTSKSIRYAVVGLGYIAQAAVLPAFKNAKKNSQLVGLISDDQKKLKELSRKYKTKLNGTYNDYEAILQSGEIDAVYIALPNHLHREYTERAARLGIHVLCEKPLAVTVAECESMIRMAKQNNIKLMTAYRLHFEEANLKAIDLLRKNKIGAPKYFESTFSMQIKAPNIRTQDINMGGGTLYDIGIYCLNAARNLFQAEPEEVFAMSSKNEDPRFKKIDEMTISVLRFSEDRLATFTTSFGSADQAVYKIVGTKGSLEVENAYEWQSAITHSLKIGDKKSKTKYSKRDQFGPELIYFSDCILKNKDVEPSGEEGLRDVKIIQALYASAERNIPIRLESLESKKNQPSVNQSIKVPPLEKAELVHAEPPHS
ncbi:MAG: Gfo/Idh/MocA family oxidoreductase [Deltaproteobacteria bacterium]|nr:Gfo/Idh/MocA family oxidoreductase [Deltaproteobacteria bacterium]